METLSRHSLESHTGDLRIRIEAPNLAELFAESARALAEIVAGGRTPPPAGEYERVELSAPDRDALLVDWLNELVFRSERARKAYSDVRVEELSDRTLTALVRGAPVPGMRSVVKAATFHGLAIADTGNGATASVILDV